MARDLEERAKDQREQLRNLQDRIAVAVAEARDELDRRHPDPSSVEPADWAEQLGATQHVATARDALSRLRAAQDRIRARLAGVDNPADLQTFQKQLRAALVADAALQVWLRLGEERVASGRAALSRLGEVFAAARAAGEAADAELRWAVARTAEAAALRDALGRPPVDTVVAEATDLRKGSVMTAAADRIKALLPDPLRTRALTRGDEAAADVDLATAQDTAGESEGDAARAAAAPLDVAVSAARRGLGVADRQLRRYVGSAAADLTTAVPLLTVVAALPDLTPAQQTALDPDSRAEAVAAVQAEQELADAVSALDDAVRAVDEAVVQAVLRDPDTDPAEDQAVIDAVEARDGSDIQAPLAQAREHYDEAARAALDDWEVEVPPRIWRAVLDLETTARTLDRLSSQGERDALVTRLDQAQDALADALDARDVQVRRELTVALTLVPRAAAAAAAGAVTADRAGQYVRGDGPGGRVPSQL